MKKILILIMPLMLLILGACGRVDESRNSEEIGRGDTYASEEEEHRTEWVSIDYHERDSIEELAEAYHHVVRVKVLSKTYDMVNVGVRLPTISDPAYAPIYRLMAIYEVLILESFKGFYEAGDVIRVMHEGGSLANLTVITGFAPFEIGDDLVLFLWHDENAIERNMPPMLTNPNQAAYRSPSLSLDIRMVNHGTELESLSPRNTLVLTVGDLLRIGGEVD